MENVETILRFWFGTATDDVEVAEECGKLWWKKNPQADAGIRERFSAVLDAVANGQRGAKRQPCSGRSSRGT